MATFQVCPSNDARWYWRLRAANYETVSWSGQTFPTQGHCQSEIAYVRSIAPTAVYDRYIDVKGEYRWRINGSDGMPIAVSEGYTTSAARDNSIAWMRANAPLANVEVVAA